MYHVCRHILKLVSKCLCVCVTGLSMKYLDEEIELFISDLAERIVKMKLKRFQHLV